MVCDLTAIDNCIGSTKAGTFPSLPHRFNRENLTAVLFSDYAYPCVSSHEKAWRGTEEVPKADETLCKQITPMPLSVRVLPHQIGEPVIQTEADDLQLTVISDAGCQ
jgi:hypothetical protein